jgi:hypothetical protein
MKSHSAERYDNLRSECLAEAMDLITGDRNREYGEPIHNFERIANGWSIILGRIVEPHEVALCMAWLKIARLVETPQKKDGWVDGAGYFALGWQLVNEQGENN